jgi:hypothetical protein
VRSRRHLLRHIITITTIGITTIGITTIGITAIGIITIGTAGGVMVTATVAGATGISVTRLQLFAGEAAAAHAAAFFLLVFRIWVEENSVTQASFFSYQISSTERRTIGCEEGFLTVAPTQFQSLNCLCQT